MFPASVRHHSAVRKDYNSLMIINTQFYFCSVHSTHTRHLKYSSLHFTMIYINSLTWKCLRTLTSSQLQLFDCLYSTTLTLSTISSTLFFLSKKLYYPSILHLFISLFIIFIFSHFVIHCLYLFTVLIKQLSLCTFYLG